MQRTWVAEVVGYRRLAGAGESRTLSLLQGLRSDLIDSAITAQNGRIVRRAGDGLKQCGYDLTRGPGCQTHGDGIIIEFRSVVAAVRCAVEVQTGMVERNAGLPAERRIEFRVRVPLDEVVEEENGNLIGPARFSEQ